MAWPSRKRIKRICLGSIFEIRRRVRSVVKPYTACLELHTSDFGSARSGRPNHNPVFELDRSVAKLTLHFLLGCHETGCCTDALGAGVNWRGFHRSGGG